MSTLRQSCVLGLTLLAGFGCSAKTQEETKEALKATGEAASAAAEDAKVNVKKAGEVLEAGVDSAKEKAAEIRSESPAGDSPSDADAIPEADEPKP